MSQTPRLALGLLEAGQIDKHTTHNEALASLDFCICAAVDGILIDTPPASPGVGDCYIVGTNPNGAWASHALALAGFTSGGWRFIAPMTGLRALDKASGEAVMFQAGTWEKGHVRAAKLSIGGNQVVGAQGAAVADPAGGTIIDGEARAAVAAILARLRGHGLIAT